MLSVGIVPVLTLSSPAAVLAQTATATSGTLSGTVSDPTGRPLAGSRVQITSAVATQVVVTGADGRFSVSVAPDTYALTVTSNGFQTSRQDGYVVRAGQATAAPVTLSAVTLQNIAQTSTTAALAPNRSAADVTNVSGQTFVDQGQTQVVNVLDQVPGIEINRSSSNAPGANTSISIRGAEPYESQILIDGHPVVSSANGAYGFNGTFINSLLLGDVEIDEGPGNLPNTIEDAIGGTLNFKTPPITGKLSATGTVGFDSFQGAYYGVKASDTFGKLGILVGAAEDETPGYLAPQNIYGGAVTPRVTAGTAYAPHIGVIDFAYPATQDFNSHSQLAKLSYDFTPRTSILLEQYSTQTNNDETGTNDEYVNALIVPCINTPPKGYTGTPNCTETGGTGNNYTSTPNQGAIGSVQPINLYAPYPNTSEFDNEPIYSAEFRTALGPGSLLARYYTGTIDRVVTQDFSPVAVIPCSTPACPNGDNLSTNPPTYSSSAYYGEPYVEDTLDVLHGFDAQYLLPLGANQLTFGFDRHTDVATFGEFDPTEGPATFTQGLGVQSLAYSLRGTFALTRKLTFSTGNYLSSTTYVGNRFDPRDGLVYKPSASSSIRASFGTAYVAPYYGILNPAPYLSSGTLYEASTGLRPETSSGYDVGADVKPQRDTLLSIDGYTNTIFNRYASVTTQIPGTFGGKPYTMETAEGNQAVVREEGVELSFLHAPRTGLGFHSAVDLLRDYAFDQSPGGTKINSTFSATPGNFVQLPEYPYSKIRNDLFYSFAGGGQARFSSTSYGENNAFGEPGFTEFDGQIRVPLHGSFFLNLGGTNLANHDDYRAGGVYDGGPTFATLAGGTSYTSQYFVQPRTLYLQLESAIGPNGPVPLSRTSL